MKNTLTTCDGERNEAIAKALESVGDRVREVGQGLWRLVLQNGRPHTTTVRYEKPWLSLDTPLQNGSEDGPAPWELMSRQAPLPHGAKYAMRRGLAAHVFAEAPILHADRMERRVHELCRGLQVGAERLHGENTDATGHKATLAGASEKDLGGLPALCEEMGWPCVERGAEGTLIVPLHGLAPNMAATIEPDAPEGLGLWTQLMSLNGTPDDETVRSAVAVMLLTVSGRTRLAKPVIRPREDGVDIGITAPLWTPLNAEELAYTLGAIHVACRLCYRELVALTDARIAEQYLGMRGGPAKDASRRRQEEE